MFHKALPSPLSARIQAALAEATQNPSRRSEILGNTALGLDAAAQRPEHLRHAPQLRALAEQIAEAALAEQTPGPAALDDFEELLQEYDTARGQFTEDINVIARADDLHDRKTAQHGARVSIAPLSWGKGATLGRAGQFKYNPNGDDVAKNIAQAATLAYWVGEPHEAQAVTVDLAPPAQAQPPPLLALPNPSITTDVSSRPRGIVSYGSDGAIARVPFDAGYGARFTVTGNYVAVQVSMDPPMAGADSGMLSYAASIGAFASPSVAPLFYTEYIDQLANAQTTPPIQRPVHATQILPILSDQPAGTVAIKFYGQGAAQLILQFFYPIGQLLIPIPIPSEIQFFTLTNFTGAVGNFRIPFQLSL